MTQKKPFPKPSTSENLPPSDQIQDRPSNLRLGNLTPEQAIAGTFKIKPADVARIKEEEKALRAANNVKGGKRKRGVKS